MASLLSLKSKTSDPISPSRAAFTDMVVNGRPLKRMKRRVTADLHDFLTFPSIDGSGSGSGPTEPFRVNIRTFLSHHALLPPPSSLFPHLLTWQILFRVGDVNDGTELSTPVTVCLDVVEEDVARSRSVYCDQCRVVGELARSESFCCWPILSLATFCFFSVLFRHASLGRSLTFSFIFPVADWYGGKSEILFVSQRIASYNAAISWDELIVDIESLYE